MVLAPGTRLGSYEIVGAIGAGGMGEVYTARDTRLHREVAIKVLPETFALDADRLTRFEREAQVLASLNHPNIAQIYGVENGALVMELVDGEDLAQRLARGALPLDEALPIARQIAEALEAAHDCGIIHRDLKPANIKVRADGVVKVLDFGLAKAMDPIASPSGPMVANSPTFTSPAAMTQMGLVLGTAAYMAPEQAKGKTVDRRADIWAFGVVLYEMLTGRQLFGRDTVAETMADVLRADIDWTATPASTPASITTLLRRCLDRDPKKRLQAIGEARILIERQLADPAHADGVSASVGRRGGPWTLVGASALAAAALTGVAVWKTVARGPDVPVRKFFITSDPVGGVQQREFSISPDGRRVVFLSGRKLYVRDLDDLRPRELKGAGETGSGESGPFPFWSPDGASIGYGNGGRLLRISALDGAPSVICNLPGAYGGGAWKPDGTIVFSTVRGPMFEVAAMGGDARVLIPLGKDDVDFHQPSLLPQGKGILYAVHRTTAVDTIEVLTGTARKVLWRSTLVSRGGPQVINLPGYSPTGHIIYRQDAGNVGVWAVAFSLDRLEKTGDPFLIAAGGANPSVADDGTLVYAPTSDTEPGQLAWLRSDGTVDSVIGEAKLGLRDPALGPDGRRIAFVASENNNDDVWVATADGGTTRITMTPGNESRPTWMPDGKTLLFVCDTDTGAGICAKAADASGDARVIIRKASGVVVSPDGGQAVYQTNGAAIRGLMAQALPSAEPRLFKTAPIVLTPLGFSPDGRYVIYSGYATGEPRIYVGRFPGGDGEWEVPGVIGERGLWLAHEIVGVIDQSRTFTVMSVPVETGGAPSFGKPHVLFGAPSNSVDLNRGLSMSLDGKKIVAVKVQRAAGDLVGIAVLQNWWAEFKR